MTKRITLAIETVVGNGSLSLLENHELIASLYGENKISRSDSFLQMLDRFLDVNKVKKTNLSAIAVSLGPGSFTGARVGLATALALKNGLGIPCRGVSVLRAIASSASQKNVIAAFLNDKNQVVWEQFDNIPKHSTVKETHEIPDKEFQKNKIKAQTLPEFYGEISLLKQEKSLDTALVLEKKLYETIIQRFGKPNKISNDGLEITCIDENLSFFIAQVVENGYASDNLKLIYLKSDLEKR